MRLNELFATFASSWPVSEIDTSWPPSTDGSMLAGLAIDAIEVEGLITAVGPDGAVTVTGTLSLISIPPAITRLTSHIFPSLGFTFIPEPDWSSAFRVSISPTGGSTVQIDELPIEVAIPGDLLSAHPSKPGADTGIELTELEEEMGVGFGESTITRNFSYLFDADGHIHLEPHLPISIGPCTIFGLPANAVHELTFIASPANARAQVDWLVRDLNPDAIAFDGGALGFGGIELDWDVEGNALNDLRSRINLDKDAEVVIEDLVLPSVLLPPVPQHGTVGLRRTLEPGESIDNFLSFNDAPIVVPLGENGHVFLSSLFFRTPEEEADWWSGLTLEGGVAWSDGGEGNCAISLGFIDGDVLRIGFEHSPAGSDLPIIHLDLWAIMVDFTAIKLGVSLVELSKDSPDPAAAIQALTTLVIKEKPGEGSGPSSAVGVKTEDGRPFEAALVDVGWDRGKPTGNLVIPHGAQLHLSLFVLEVQEMGLAYEHGATYFSISGGIRAMYDPLKGGVWFKRLRGKIGGNPDAPDFLLGGIGLYLGIDEVVDIIAHGSYRDEIEHDGTRIQETGLGGGIVIYAGKNEWGLTADVYWGSRIPRNPTTGDHHDYLLFLLALFGAIPMGPIELRGIEALYASGLMPKIDTSDREAGQLKYYKWLKRAQPTALPETRDLAASWKPTKDAWAFGLGLNVSITGAGSVFQIKAFGAGFDSPIDSGLIIVIEFGIFGSKKPLGIGVIEYDFKREALVVQIQIDVALKDFIDNFPDRLADIKVGGTLVFGNMPGLVALGRLHAPDTWFGCKLNYQLSPAFELKLRAGFCIEWLEDEHVGGGLVIAISVTGDAGVISLKGWGALEVLLRYMSSGTNDFVAQLRLELGLAIILFRFLRFGISMELLAEWLAHVPNYFVFRATFRFETPWFLPDVSYTAEATEGTLAPADRGMTTAPLLSSSAASRTSSKLISVKRADGNEPGEKATLSSVNNLTSASGAWSGATEPIPLDSTVEINFSVMLADLLRIDSIDPDLGDQVSGDGTMQMTGRYELIGISMRRRPLSGGAWETVEDITSASSPRNFRWSWDQDSRVQGKIAPNKLLLNGSAPFSVGINNPLADAEILTSNPSYPCCQVRMPDVARFDFEDVPLGLLQGGFVRDFRYQERDTVAPLRIHGIACSVIEPTVSGVTTTRVGTFAPTQGAVITVAASEDVAVALVRVAVIGKRKARLTLIANDRDGEEIFRKLITTGASSIFEVAIDPAQPFASLLINIEDLQQDKPDSPNLTSIVLESIDCITQRDRERYVAEKDRCSRENSEDQPDTVTFLARHEYEIALTTSVSIKHSSTNWESSTITEYVGFKTAGPPGLNETPEPGLELEPYIVSHSPGGRGLTYREESVYMVLSDALRVFGPGAGSGEEDFRLPITIVVESKFDSNPSAHIGKSSHASADWFLTNRGELDPWVRASMLGISFALTSDGKALRYKSLTEASTGGCTRDDVWIEQQPRVGVQPFDPNGRALWEATSSYEAIMRLEDGPVVDRTSFEDADITAFTSVSGLWSVVDGALVASNSSSGAFGDDDWDLYLVDVRGSIGENGEFGVVVLADATLPSNGVRALVRRGTGTGGTLVVETATGVTIDSKSISQIGEKSGLVVETFADSIRCRCGDTVISVPRDDRGPGSCQLLSTAASIASLHVHGIDMYRLPFRTSRYEGFADHVGTFSQLERFDAGTAAEPLASVVTRLGGMITAAMNPSSPDVDRERCFSDAARSLAVPLREDADHVHLTCISNDSDRWLLLETPEPMDFTEEIELTLSRRVVQSTLLPSDRARLGALIEAALRSLPRRFLLPELFGVRRLIFPKRFFSKGDIPRSNNNPFKALVDGILGTFDAIKAVFKALMDGIRGVLKSVFRIRTDTSTASKAPVRSQFGGILDAPGSRKAVYQARLEGKFIVVKHLLTKAETRVKAPPLSLKDRKLLTRVSVDLNALLHIVEWHTPTRIEWVEQPITIIQNAPATHALILPASSLHDGTYRLEMSITRRWFDTIDPISTDNAYLDDVSVSITLAG